MESKYANVKIIADVDDFTMFAIPEIYMKRTRKNLMFNPFNVPLLNIFWTGTRPGLEISFMDSKDRRGKRR